MALNVIDKIVSLLFEGAISCRVHRLQLGSMNSHKACIMSQSSASFMTSLEGKKEV